MQESTLYIIIWALALLFPVACAVSCFSAKSFEMQSGHMERMVSKYTLPAAILGNAVFYFLVLAFLFPYQNPVSLFSRLFCLQCSYQDVSRFVGVNALCLIWSAVFPIILLRWHLGEGAFASRNKRSDTIVFLLLSVCLIPLIAGARVGGEGRDGIQLTEVCRKTATESVQMISGSIVEDMGSYITIRNNGLLAFEADTLLLSTKEDIAKQIAIKNVLIKHGEDYVYRMKSTEGLNISKSGGSVVYLNAADGSVLDKVKVPELEVEQAYRRTEGGWDIVQLVAPEAEPVEVDMPVFSAESGFYDGEFDLTISAPKGTKIYYTLDGSNPTAGSSRYKGAIHVYDRSGEEPIFQNEKRVRYEYERQELHLYHNTDRCFVVRAIAIDQDGNVSPIKTASYFINAEKYRNGTVVSLVSDPDGLFGEDGICVTGREYDEWYQEQLEIVGADGKLNYESRPLGNFEKHGDEWEREASFEMFENAQKKISKQVGIRVQGNYSRHSLRLKRFSIYARNRYDGSSYFDVPLVNSHLQHALVLRQGDNFAVTQRLSANRAAASIDGIPVTVFLDGEYYYQTFLYEKFNETNFAEKYDLIDENIVMVSGGDQSGVEDTSDCNFNALIRLFGEENADIVYQKFSEAADVQSYIDDTIINLYMANMDYTEGINNLLWHTVVKEDDEYGDTRWHWGIIDTDMNWEQLDSKFAGIEPYQIDPFTMNGHYQTVHEWITYPKLIQNEAFRKQFILSFQDLINYDFEPERALHAMKKLGIKNEELEQFFTKRPKYMVSFLAKEFQLDEELGNITLTSNRSDSPITLNTITPELVDGEWSGQYFTDYPVTVTANEKGFSHWEVTTKGNTVTLKDKTIEVPVEKGGTSIRAVFQ